MVTYYDTVEIPVWAVCYIVYGDDTGIGREDIEAVDEYLSSLPEDACLDFKEGDSHFAHSNAVHNLGDDVIYADIYIPKATK